MTTYFVAGTADFAPTSGRNGSETAPWLPGDVIWGSSGVKGNDTLRFVKNSGWETVTGIWSVGNHGATSGSPCIIDLNGVSLNNLSYLWNTRANTVIKNGAKVPCLTYEPSAANCVYIDCHLVGKGDLSTIRIGTNGNHYNTRIARCTFSSPVEPTGVTTGAIVWRPSGTDTSNIYGLIIEDCEFEDFKAVRGLICMMTGISDLRRVQNLVIRRLTFKNVKGLPIDIECAGPDSGLHPSLKGTIDWSSGVIVEDICGENVECNIVPGSTTSYFGGLVFISGFGNSATPGFGTNKVGPLYGKNLSGDAGLCDLLYGTYQGKVASFDHPDYPGLRGKSLWVEGMNSPNIDGNALLFDVGCHDSYFPGIKAKDVTGNPAKNNSGAVVMFLENATNCSASGIEFENVKCLLFVGASGSQSSGCISNFTGTGLIDYLALIGSTATLADNIRLVNGVVEGSYGVRNERGAGNPWKGESNNFVRGSSTKNLNHAFAADTRVGVDPMLDPITRRPMPGSPLLRAGKYPGLRVRDAAGRRFALPVPIGAYDREPLPRSSRY